MLATNKITFVSPERRPDADGAGEGGAGGRHAASSAPDQLVRAQVIWRAEPGLTVPLTAVTRINGQYFVYVVEKQGDMTVARQKGGHARPI